MIVQIRPSVSFGLPSTISSARMLTSLIFLYRRKSNAICPFCSMWKRILPFSLGCNETNNKLVSENESDLKWLINLQDARQIILPKEIADCVHPANLRTSRLLVVRPVGWKRVKLVVEQINCIIKKPSCNNQQFSGHQTHETRKVIYYLCLKTT